jgi:glycosyltransferase involved in cell wall biosynthesis
MPKLRILVVHCAYQQHGGEDSVVASEVELLQTHGHDVRLWLRRNADISSMPTWKVARDTLWSFQTELDLEALSRDWRPDVVHVHNTSLLLSPSVFWAARRLGIPVVQTLHNFRLGCLNATFLRNGQVCESCIGKPPLTGVIHGCFRDSRAQSAVLASSIMLHRWRGTYTEQVNRFIVLTEFARQKFLQIGLPEEKLRIKPNFLPWCEVPDLDNREGGLYVGRLSVEKGIDVLLQAAHQLDLQRYPMTVVGTGPQADATRTALGQHYKGHMPLPEVLAQMERAAYLILPSVCYEGFPRTVVEAFSRGLPVIASRLGSMAELIQDGETGLLFEAGNAAELAERIRWAHEHPAAMSAMGARARQIYEQHFTADRNHQTLMTVYQEAMRSNANGQCEQDQGCPLVPPPTRNSARIEDSERLTLK